MSTRPKAFLKQAKPKQKREQKLEDADDFQAVGVDFEDAAGKWRAGDPAKSMRFFQRALEVYEQGLNRFPQSLDLAYNKARVQLEVATHPLLVKHLQLPVLQALQLALESHRYALSLDQDNPDALFNTAQVLTSIAEELAKDSDHADAETLPLLEEALELQTRCLTLQEVRLEESLEQASQPQQQASALPENASDEEDGGAPVETPSQTTQEDQWFSIVEPVTKDTLIDTVLAQLSTLTTLCGIISNSPELAPSAFLAWVEEYSSNLLNHKLPYYIRDNESDRLQEIALTKANFLSSLLEAGFRSQRIEVDTYKRERDAAFAVTELRLDSNTEALLSNARSMIAFNSALADADMTGAPSDTTRWNGLSAAISSLVNASKIPNNPSADQAKTHFLRGDVSLLQHGMSGPPTNYPPAVANAKQLLKNAEVFYRNASKISPDEDERSIAILRSTVAVYLQGGDKSGLAILVQGRGLDWVHDQLEDLLLEGLVTKDLVLELS